MFETQPAAGIVRYLIETHNPKCIIVSGSYADGTYNEASDFDCWLIGRDPKRVRHDTSIVNGVELQAEIYPQAYFDAMPLHMQKYFVGALLAYDPEGLGEKFLEKIGENMRAYPCMTREKKNQTAAYLEKMLRRAEAKDFHGDYRGHMMMAQSLECWCDFSDRVFPGAKKTLRMMEKVDAESAALCRRAMRSFEIEDMRAWVKRLHAICEANGGREFRIFEK